MRWLLRGLVFAFLMVLLRLIQGALINTHETQAGLISAVLVVIYFILVVIWGYVDGRRDANRSPDPERRADLAMTWLIAGLVAGILSGLVTWIIGLFYKSLYVEQLLNEVTTFAAFTALLVFIGAMIGVAVGRWLVDRRYKKDQEAGRGSRHGRDEDADTDVFQAARGDERQGEEHPAR